MRERVQEMNSGALLTQAHKPCLKPCCLVRLGTSGKLTMRANGKKRPSDRYGVMVFLDEPLLGTSCMMQLVKV